MSVVQSAFVDLTNGDRLDLTFNPDQIQDSLRSEVDSPIIPGASRPRTSVSAGGLRLINFTVRLARVNNLEPVTIVRDQISWFYSVQSPYSGNTFDEQIFTPIQWVWGDMYDLPVVIRSAESSMLYFRGEDGLPEWADMELQLEEISPDTIFTPEIRTSNQAFVRFLPLA